MAHRPRLAIKAARREAFLAILQFQAHETAVPWPTRYLPTRTTSCSWVALRVVVTGNLRHFPARCRGPVTVLSPRAALERLVGFDLNA